MTKSRAGRLLVGLVVFAYPGMLSLGCSSPGSGGASGNGGSGTSHGGAGGTGHAGSGGGGGTSHGGAGGTSRTGSGGGGGTSHGGSGGGGSGGSLAGTNGGGSGGSQGGSGGGAGGYLASDAAADARENRDTYGDTRANSDTNSDINTGSDANVAIDSGPDPNRPVYAYGATVENTSVDCVVPALADASKLSKISKLPDPFKKLDGTSMTKRSEWRCRRQEILEQAKKYVFGDRPTPDVVTGTVAKNKISVHVEAQGKKIDFTADIVLPSKGTAPFPALISVGAKSGMGGLTMGESRILNEGVAVIYYDNYKLGVEGTPEASRGKPNPGLFYDIYGGTHSAGLLMAWSWGASRMIDVLQQSGGDIIDYQRLGVTGCSRLGKGAFVIGLFDERIALTIPQEPSTGGDPALRIMDVLSGAERTDYNYNGLNWLSNNFAPFVYSGSSNVVKLPIDTHSMIATMAPRGLLVLENPHQTQMGAPAGHTASLAGAEVYKALGVQENISYHSNVSDTAHCSYKTEYTDILIKTITKFLKHESATTGKFDVGSGGSLNRSDWIDWQTPTLQGDLPANWVLTN